MIKYVLQFLHGSRTAWLESKIELGPWTRVVLLNFGVTAQSLGLKTKLGLQLGS